MSTRKAPKRVNASKVVEHKPNKKVKQTGAVLVTGAGDVGQLGLGSDVPEKYRPAIVPLHHEVVHVCAGGMHTVCLTKEGQVLTFGCNDEGALGRLTPEEEDAFIPGEVQLPEKATQISAGDSHTAALLTNGRVYVWGTFRDSHGPMGLTVNGNECLPHPILPDEIVVKISSGADHLAMLTNYGEVLTCGCAEQGQLGRVSGRRCDRESRTQLSQFLVPAPIQTKVTLRLKFENIWAGTYCTFAKVIDREDIYVFGLNNYGQIGLEAQTTHYSPELCPEFSSRDWHQICCAQHHTIALDKDGKVFALGRKEYGRLGLGADCQDALKLTEIPTLADKKCVYIACGSATSFAVTDKGELYGWGMGTSGQLGTGDDEDCVVPTQIRGKQLKDSLALKVSSGGQHTVILATTANNNKMKNSQ